MHLSDITFIEEGNPDFINNKGISLINISKHHMIYTSIQKLLQYKTGTTRYTMSRAEPIFTFLFELPTLSESSLYEISLEREPKNALAKDID